MDDQRRRALEARRAALKEAGAAAALEARWQARVAAVQPAVSALRAAGEDFVLEDAGQHPSWQPDWIPHGSADFLWHLAPHIEMEPHEQDGRGRSKALASALSNIAPADDEVFVVFESVWIALRMASATAIRFSNELVEAAGWDELWIGHASGSWLVRSHFDGCWSFTPERK